MTPRDARALARRVVVQRRVLRWQVWQGRRLLAAAPARIIGSEKEDAEAWARRCFPSRTGLEVRGVC
jgi:hypothetical protein